MTKAKPEFSKWPVRQRLKLESVPQAYLGIPRRSSQIAILLNGLYVHYDTPTLAAPFDAEFDNFNHITIGYTSDAFFHWIEELIMSPKTKKPTLRLEAADGSNTLDWQAVVSINDVRFTVFPIHIDATGAGMLHFTPIR